MSDITIAGQCRINPWPTVPDWPWCRNTDAGLTQMNTGENSDARLTFFRHSGICLMSYTFPPPAWDARIFSFPDPQSMCVWCGCDGGSLSITSRVWTWGCILSTTNKVWTSGCIPFHYQQGVNIRGYSFPPQAGCEHQGVSLSTTSKVWREGVSFSPLVGFERQGVSFSTTSRMWTWDFIH